jgi:hypothetical protein
MNNSEQFKWTLGNVHIIKGLNGQKYRGIGGQSL